MRTKAQIKDQRTFSRQVFARMREMGLLQKFVAEKIHLSSSRLSQFLGGFRQMPVKVKADLMQFLKMEVKETH